MVTLIILLLALICAVFLAGLATTYVWSSNAARRGRSLRMVLLLLGDIPLVPLPAGRRGPRGYGRCTCNADSVMREVDHQADE